MKSFKFSLMAIMILISVFFSCSDDKSTNPDGTSYFRITDANGYYYLSDSKGWIQYFQTAYKYDSAGRITNTDFVENYLDYYEESYKDSFIYENSTILQPLQHEKYIPVSKGWMLEKRNTYTYENQKPKEILSENYDNYGELTDTVKTVFTYDNGYITKSVEYLYDAGSWQNYSEMNLFYLNGLITGTQYSDADGASGNETFAYSGNLLTEYYCDYSIPFFSSFLKIKFKALLIYDNNVLTEIAIYVFDDETGAWVKERRETYEYTSSNLTNAYNYNWDTDLLEWLKDYKATYSYDTDKNYIEGETNQWNSSLNGYVLSDEDEKIENIYEDKKGNYIEIDKCLNPLTYYTGKTLSMMDPYPSPSKSFGIEKVGNPVKTAIKKFIDKKIKMAKVK